MPSDYLASVLVEAIRDEGMLPKAESGQTARLIAVMNREARLWLTKLMIDAGGGHETVSTDIPVVAGTRNYRVPKRAVLSGLKQVELVQTGSEPVPLNRIERPRVNENNIMGGAGNYYMQGNEIVLIADPSFTGSLRLTWVRRMNKLVPADETAEITAIDTNTNEITFALAPTDFSSSQTFDLIQATPHFEVLDTDLTATLAGTEPSMTLTFSDELPEDLVVGDYVALAGQTPILNAPLELHDVLVMRAAFKYLSSLGDPKAAYAKAEVDELRDAALSLLQPRVKDSPQVLINYNAPGWNRGRGRFR